MKPLFDTENTKAFYTPAELASRWGITPMTLRRWRQAGKIKACHIGRGIRFSWAEVKRFEEEAST